MQTNDYYWQINKVQFLKNSIKHWKYFYDYNQTFTNQITALNNPWWVHWQLNQNKH